MKSFYLRYFQGTASKKYRNPKKGFESYFISFGNATRLELMRSKSMITEKTGEKGYNFGYSHLAFSTGSEEVVDLLTEEIEKTGCTVVSRPRKTGDGYYESSIRDPEGNLVEITV